MGNLEKVIRHCCIICYKDCDCCGDNEFVSKQKIISQFFQMLERHLSNPKKKNEQLSLLFQIFKTNSELLHSCTDCFGNLKSFCDLYHELERTKLLMNWRLGNLTSAMSSARREKSRMGNFKESLKLAVKTKGKSLAGGSSDLDVPELEAFFDIKKYLEDLCSSKVSKSLPKVRMEGMPKGPCPLPVSSDVAATSNGFEEGSSSQKNNDDAGLQSKSNLKSQKDNSNERNVNQIKLDLAGNAEEPGELEVLGHLSPVLANQVPEVTPESNCNAVPEHPLQINGTRGNATPKNPLQTSDHHQIKIELKSPQIKLDSPGKQVLPAEEPQTHPTVSKNLKFELDQAVPTLSPEDPGPENNSDGYEHFPCGNDSDTTGTSDDEEDEKLPSTEIVTMVTNPSPSPLSPATPVLNDAVDAETPVEEEQSQSPETTKNENGILPDKQSPEKETETNASLSSRSGRRPLRSIQNCDKCHKTFSTKASLAAHLLFGCSSQKTVETSKSKSTETEPGNNSDDGNGDSDFNENDLSSSASSSDAEYDDGLISEDEDEDEVQLSSDEDSDCESPSSSNKKRKKTKLKETSVLPTCFNCGTSFRNHLLLKKHVVKVHSKSSGGGDGSKILCKTCGDSFSSVRDFRSHTEKKHHHKLDETRCTTVPFRFQCPDPSCSELFIELHSLLKHRKEKSAEPDQNNLISVKILLFPSNFSRGSPSLEDGQEFATVEVPSEVFFCDVEGCSWNPLYSQEDLREHSKLHGEFQCKFCPKMESFAPDLAKHELDSHGAKGKGQCPRCSFTFTAEQPQYRIHFFKEHLGLPASSALNYSCGICKMYEKVTNHDLKVFRHYITQHDSNQPEDRIVRCLQTEAETGKSCPAYFVGKGITVHHKLWHSGQLYRKQKSAKIKCDICSKCFSDRNRLRKHRRGVHKVYFGVECKHPGCQSKFETEKDAQEHFKHQHPKGAKDPIKCPECDQTFWNQARLDNHVRFKHKENPDPEKRFVCGTCGKVFSNKTHLEQHELTHSGPASWKFTCSVCGRKCRTNDKLKEHERTHKKEKPFVCDLCGQSYAHKHNLRNHVNSKHGDNPEEKPFVCDFCGNRYAHRHNWRNHVKDKHGDDKVPGTPRTSVPRPGKGIKRKRILEDDCETSSE